jgi:hypothetical protein
MEIALIIKVIAYVLLIIALFL